MKLSLSRAHLAVFPLQRRLIHGGNSPRQSRRSVAELRPVLTSGIQAASRDDNPGEPHALPLISSESLRALDSVQLSEISGDALARFLAYMTQYRNMLSPELLDDISATFHMSIHLQELITSHKQAKEAASEAVHAAAAACEEAFWHPDFAASLARLQLALNVGDRTFWNRITHQLPDIVTEVEPHALSDIAHAAAALGLRHARLWAPVATAIDAMSLQMTPKELDVALRALVAARPQLSPELTNAVGLRTLREVVQWRCSCGTYNPEKLPGVILACAALFHPSGVDTRPKSDAEDSEEDAEAAAEQILQSRPEEFWNDVLEASREHWLQYRNSGKVRIAVALWWAARCVDRGPKGTARGVKGSDVGTRMARALRHHACVLCDSVLHIPTKSVNIMGEVDDDGEMIDLSGESLARKDAWRISLLVCAEAQARMNPTRLGNLADGLTQRIREVSTNDPPDVVHDQLCVLGVEACAFTSIGTRVIRENRSPKDIEAAENELAGVLGLAVDRHVVVPSADALRMLSDLQNVPYGVVRYGEDFAPVVSWLLQQMRGGMHTLHEGEIALLLKTLVGAHIRLKDHPEFAEELRDAVARATYRPRLTYSSSEFLTTEDGSQNASLQQWEIAEREERMWLQAHGRNAPGFNPTEAAEAALAAKSLGLFHGGSTQVEALLAVSMSGSAQAGGNGNGSNGAAASSQPGHKRRPRHRGCVDKTLLATFESFTARLMPVTASWLSDSDVYGSGGGAYGSENGNGSIPRNSVYVADIDVTRDSPQVYSVLGAADPTLMGSEVDVSGAAALYALSDGEAECESGNGFDGEAAEAVSHVMQQSGCGVLECLQALEERAWDAQAAIEFLLEEQLVAEQEQEVQAGAEER